SGAEVIATSMELAKRLGKVGVLVGNCRAFVGNRMFDPYVREAQFLVEEGAKIEEVDAAMTAFGMAMGPLAVDDLAGIDVGWRIRNEYRHLTPAGWREPRVAGQLARRGRYRPKTGARRVPYRPGRPAASAHGAAGRRRPTRRRPSSPRRSPGRPASRGARSRRRRSSNASSMRSLTRGRRSWRKASPCGPGTST